MVQLIGKLDILKDFITALFLFHLSKEKEIVIGISDKNWLVSLYKNKVEWKIILTYLNILDHPALTNTYNNHILILTENEILEWEYTKLFIDWTIINPYQYALWVKEKT